jgi:small-conductance mechanosensitive channel
VDFGIRAWTRDFANHAAVRTELAMRVTEALAKAGIVMPFAQQDVHIRSLAPEVRTELARASSATGASTPAREDAAADEPRSAADTTSHPPAGSPDSDPF